MRRAGTRRLFYHLIRKENKMSYGHDNSYAKTDFDFATANGVIGGVYCILMVLIVLGALGGVLLMMQRDGTSVGLTTIVSCIVSGMIL